MDVESLEIKTHRMTQYGVNSSEEQRADLGAVQLQLVVSDPPGFAVLQPLGRLLLHVVFLQPIRLDQLLKGRRAA